MYFFEKNYFTFLRYSNFYFSLLYYKQINTKLHEKIIYHHFSVFYNNFFILI